GLALGGGGGQGGEAALDDLLLAVPFGDLVGGRVGARRQVAQRRQHAAQLVQVFVPLAQRPGQGGVRVFEDDGVGAGGHRQAVLVVPQGEGAGLVSQPDLAVLEHPPVLVFEQRQQDLVLQRH